MAQLSARNVLYLKISDSLTTEEVRSLRSLVTNDGHLPRGKVEKATAQDIFIMLEQKLIISKGNLGFLMDILTHLNHRRLADEARNVEREERGEVFISYCSDPYTDKKRTKEEIKNDVEQQKDRVKELSDELRRNGVDTSTPTSSTGKGTKRKRGSGGASSSTHTPKRVFISYSMDPYIDQNRTDLERSIDVDEQRKKVRALADKLRNHGVDAWIDQYDEYNPPQLWTIWMEEEISKADYVLMICSPHYKECVMGKRNETAASGFGVRFEGQVIYSLLNNPQNHGKFLPVFFDTIYRNHVPTVLGGAHFYGPIVTPPDLAHEKYRVLLSKILGRQPQGQGPPPVNPPPF
ncbi:Hypp8820 [Branchiostoma lanceolatum]|uniref:Hypp8820 protein n=1 Tax=Branchiostoma lanceolatum TaxID=7740 RepID=A0A8J9ZB03_BRALA|nr:Hypp8820 [Branchiostoma lanceolatum]